MRPPASPRALAGALACVLGASASPAWPQALPEMASVRALECIEGGSELYVSGRHLGTGTSGWTVDLAGVPLEIREWKDDRIRARVPDAIRDLAGSERPDLTLRSQRGGMLARLPRAVRLCAEPGAGEPGRAPGAGPVPEAIAD